MRTFRVAAVFSALAVLAGWRTSAIDGVMGGLLMFGLVYSGAAVVERFRTAQQRSGIRDDRSRKRGPETVPTRSDDEVEATVVLEGALGDGQYTEVSYSTATWTQEQLDQVRLGLSDRSVTFWMDEGDLVADYSAELVIDRIIADVIR